MTYDEDVADAIRVVLQDRDDVAERRMFGGLAFLVGGHLAVAASGQGGLMLRCDPADTDAHVVDGAERMVMKGRAADGWLRVQTGPDTDDATFARWVGVGTAYASQLPPR